MSLFSTFSQITWKKKRVSCCSLGNEGGGGGQAAAAPAASISGVAQAVRGRGEDVVGRTYWDTVKILLANTLGLSLALLEGVLVLELGSHFGGSR